jgi:N-acetylglutamate synthase-like GNAT family acetyltransferase|tara:strand:- start:294 stop:752 length:459 start_codon:yes stop_codon:yes gene_type:complete
MEEGNYNIRKATLKDGIDIREVLKTWLPESPHNFGSANNKKLLDNILFYIRNSFVIVVVNKNNVIVGTLGATIDDTWFTDKKFLRMLWIHVLPKCRNFKVVRSMMIVLKEYAKSIKKTLLLEIFQGKDVERKHKLFIKLGFKPLGGIYGFFI